MNVGPTIASDAVDGTSPHDCNKSPIIFFNLNMQPVAEFIKHCRIDSYTQHVYTGGYYGYCHDNLIVREIFQGSHYQRLLDNMFSMISRIADLNYQDPIHDQWFISQPNNAPTLICREMSANDIATALHVPVKTVFDYFELMIRVSKNS